MNKECSSVSQRTRVHPSARAHSSAACSDLASAVLRAIDVSALATQLVSPRTLGRQLSALCIFHEDHSPSLSVNAETGKFVCFGCGARGDIFDLAGRAWGIEGFRARVEAVARWGNLPWMLSASRHVLADQPRIVAAKAQQPRAERKAIDKREVEALWSSLVPVTDDAEVVDYLGMRRINAGAVADRDVARAIPKHHRLPRWAAFQRVPWSSSGHRLVAPLFDCDGRLCSVTARRVLDTDSDGRKALFPPGRRSGLILADASGQWLLRAPSQALAREVWVAEGLTDFLALSCDMSLADETAPAALAIVGPASWSSALAARLPDAMSVVIAVDRDEAGERYAKEIAHSLCARRMRIERWVPRSRRECP